MHQLKFIVISLVLVPAVHLVYASYNGEKKQDNTYENLTEQGSYDFIVVGSGPGGGTVATRLALRGFKVLLIEAGKDYDTRNTSIPGLWPNSVNDDEMRWDMKAYLFNNSAQQSTEQILYPRASLLGGCSMHNVMIALSAHPLDWDKMAKLLDDESWNFKNMQKYRHIVENCEYCSKKNKTKFRGWLNISVPQIPIKKDVKLISLFDTITEQLVYNPDVNHNNTYESWFLGADLITKETATRSSIYQRIKEVQKLRPKNLHVWTNTFVMKIIIENKQARGVNYVKSHPSRRSDLYSASPKSTIDQRNRSSQRQYSIYAKYDVIISGGAFNTPQILQLSGIGNKKLLKKYNIKVKENLAGVGRNMQDHHEVTYILKMKQNWTLLKGCIFGANNSDPCLAEYYKTRKNVYANNGNLVSWLHSTKPSLQLPETYIKSSI
ncbi:unnamed protein product [Didymodactylos carnosus]|uniref:Glucose-methanol-choline oxidoreductase N-terminal domain-containing protein n=1 Tax=Didymodactylos carnosus TaxID=1234261 RepID=A0A8S2NYL6_9BILA|nr:unnamed protein product [Didymodactylos carnosus]CAF4018882.1 unnamed protein product [Didymodactylos carnosus]